MMFTQQSVMWTSRPRRSMSSAFAKVSMTRRVIRRSRPVECARKPVKFVQGGVACVAARRNAAPTTAAGLVEIAQVPAYSSLAPH